MDAASFKQQFLPCHAKLYRVAFRLMGNVQDAEDMVQEAYLKLWKKRDELSEVASIEAYCVTLIKNLCYDSLRSCRPDEDSRLPEELKLPTDSNIAREIEQKDEARQVKRLIRQLPRSQQQIILLRDVNDCSYEEIEQVTGLTAHQKRGIRARITAGNDQSLGTLAVRERVKEFALLHKVGFLEAVEPMNEIVEISGHACRSEKQMVAAV